MRKWVTLGAVSGVEDGGGTPSGRTAVEIYGQCLKCRDCVDVTLWVKPMGSDGIRRARLEPKSDVKTHGGLLFHAHNGCEGVIRAIRPPYPIRLEGTIAD